MEKHKELSVFERGMIIGLHKGNHGASDISRILDIPRQTCQYVIKKFCEEGLTDTLPRSGRPPLLTEREERALIHQVKENRKVSIEEITENFNQLSLTQISTSTSRRILHKHDYFGRIGKRKPFVSENNRQKRLKWCKERKLWNEEWDNIIWSDESRFLLFENDGQQWVWRQPHEKYDVDCLVPTVKSGNNGVMIWGCFVKNKLGPLVVLDGRITGEVYKNFVRCSFIAFYRKLG
jgi:transposase